MESGRRETETRERQMRRLVSWTLRRWQTHPDAADLNQEARLAAWRACEQYRGPALWQTIAVKAARWAVLEWLRSPRCSDRCEQMAREGDEEGAEGQRQARWRSESRDSVNAPEPPDERLIAAAEEHALGLMESATPREQEALKLLYGEEISTHAAAVRMHVSDGRVVQLRNSALARYQKLLGIPVHSPDRKRAHGS